LDNSGIGITCKANALYYEFEEVGMNSQLGYTSPADSTDRYPQFYWSSVTTRIQPAIRYLNVTSSGRQWIAILYGNVFRAERDLNLSGLEQSTAPANLRRGPRSFLNLWLPVFRNAASVSPLPAISPHNKRL
jgi:hypothetical protein